jgi:ABC-2 type transport system permease protein
MLLRILGLMIKELLVLLRDKRSRAVLLVPPIVQTIVFGYAASFHLEHIRLAIYDEDRSALSREMTARFSGSPQIDMVGALTHAGQIEPLLVEREVLAVVRIPQGFSRDLNADRTARLQVILDGRNSNTALLARRYLLAIGEQFAIDYRTATDWRHRTGFMETGIQVQTRDWFNENLESKWYIVPGVIGILTLTIVLLVTALTVSRELEQGTLDLLRMMPFRTFEIFAGKALPGFVVGLFEATLMAAIAAFWFEVPFRGNLLTLYIGIMVFVAGVIGIGLIIAALATTLQQSVIGAFLFIVPAMLLSGFVTPIANMSGPVRDLTMINPLRHFIALARGIFLEGQPLSMAGAELWPLALIAAASLMVAYLLFRWRVYR